MKEFKLDDIDFSAEYLMFGISGHLKDYRICHYLNQNLSLGLEKKNNLHFIWGTHQEGSDFSFYYFPDEEMELNYHLITNRSSQGIVLPVFKNMDYLFFVNGIIDDLDETKLLKQIRQIPKILTVSKIDTASLKKKDRTEINALLSDIELHIIDNH